jgi:hypothetical protein
MHVRERGRGEIEVRPKLGTATGNFFSSKRDHMGEVGSG